MDKYDLLEAMSGIRDQYIEEAAGTVSGSAPVSAFASVSEGGSASAASSVFTPASEASQASEAASASGFAVSPHGPHLQNTEKDENETISGAPKAPESRASEAKTCFREEEKESRKKSAASRRRRIFRLERLAASLAAVLCLSILVPNISSGAASAFQRLPLVGNYFRAVTFRTWQYADSTSDAYVEEPAVVTMSSGEVEVEDSEDIEKSGGENAAADEASFDAGDGTGGAAAADPAAVQAALSAAQITEEIRQMASDQICGFETSLAEETGYRSLRFLHKTVTDTDKWFCMEVYAYSSAADGFEQVTHFTIDKVTGERVTLESFFGEETDYMVPISDYIKTQMRAQMQADPDVEYWIDSREEPEYDFTQILPDQDFYFNADGNLVICFNEGEAAPMYMGTVEFTIPQEVVDGIKP